MFRKGMWGTKAGIEEHLMEAWYSGDFQKCMKVVLRRFPNNGGDSVPTDHLLSKTRLLILGLGYFQLSCCTKVFNGNPTHTKKKTVSKTKGCSLKTNSRAQMLRKIPTQLIPYEEVDLVTAWSLYPYILASLVQKGIM